MSEPSQWLLRTDGDVYRDYDGDVEQDDGEPVGQYVVAATYEVNAERVVVSTSRSFQDHAYDYRDNTPLVRAWLRWLTGPR